MVVVAVYHENPAVVGGVFVCVILTPGRKGRARRESASAPVQQARGQQAYAHQ